VSASDRTVAADRTVVIAGGGPTGLMLALELGLAGIPAVVLEKDPVQNENSHALGIHPRAAEAFEQRGLLPEFGTDIPPWPRLHFSMLWLDVPRSGDDFTLVVAQRRTQEILAQHATELGVRIRRGHEVVGVAHDADGVEVTVRADGAEYTLPARYLVGCDGPDSAVRDLAGFEVDESPQSYYGIFGDVELPEGETAEFVTDVNANGIYCIWPFENQAIRVMSIEFDAKPEGAEVPVTLDELTDSVRRVTGLEKKFVGLRWLHRYGGTTLNARSYRNGSVFLAGDAAHRHFVHANHGMNTGIQDAVNLGWKLAAAIDGRAPAGLLDSYDGERHPVGHRACGHGDAQLAIMQSMERSPGLRELVAELIETDDANRHLVTRVTSVRYPFAAPGEEPAHPLLGARVPGALLQPDVTADAAHPLHSGRGVVFDLSEGGAPAVREALDWKDRVDVVATGPVSGVDAAALLVRPDGFVAWVDASGEDAAGLRTALLAWFGDPA
jgi:2-polyprenyl-6-methoxyphenol hydroxylase-like FAD-dependent oxidoreductase